MRDSVRISLVVLVNFLFVATAVFWAERHGIDLESVRLMDAMSDYKSGFGLVFAALMVGSVIADLLILGWPSEDRVLATRLINAYIKGLESGDKSKNKAAKKRGR